MRRNLKVLRAKQGLTQAEMCDKLGCDRVAYLHIENGKSSGRLSFWYNLQKAFDIADEEMWALTKDDGIRKVGR